MDWNDVLKNGLLIKGVLETRDENGLFISPVESIEPLDGHTCISSLWVAKLDADSKKWKYWPTASLNLLVNCQPTMIHDGIIYFKLPRKGIGLIYPRGYFKLDYREVDGLVLDQPE